MRILIVILSTALCGGCATFAPSQSPLWPWPDGTKPCAQHPCSESEALDAYLKAHMYCRAVHNWYERDGSRTGATQASVGTLGALAGAVASPLAKGSAAKAWAGLSGASNAMQTSIKENLSGSIAAKRTKAILAATEGGEGKYAAATDPTAKVLTMIDLATACAMAPAKADGEALRALSM